MWLKLRVLSILMCLLNTTLAYKHVILMHGLFGSTLEFFRLENSIQKAHPGTTMNSIALYDGLESLEPMDKQVARITRKMRQIMRKHPEGVHLVCYSQGGLICRAVLQELDDHNVQHFVSLSAPQAGQYGDTKFLKYLFPHLLKEELWKFFYTAAGQKVSIANYWNDPNHQERYYKESNFLAILNNQSVSNVNITRSHEYKKNFMRIKKLVLIGGPDDEVITPWQSSQFVAYNPNDTSLSVSQMKKQPWYVSDSFGLQSLDKRGDIVTYSVPGHAHLDWPRDFKVFRDCIEKWLD